MDARARFLTVERFSCSVSYIPIKHDMSDLALRVQVRQLMASSRVVACFCV